MSDGLSDAARMVQNAYSITHAEERDSDFNRWTAIDKPYRMANAIQVYEQARDHLLSLIAGINKATPEIISERKRELRTKAKVLATRLREFADELEAKL